MGLSMIFCMDLHCITICVTACVFARSVYVGVRVRALTCMRVCKFYLSLNVCIFFILFVAH